MKSYKKNLLFLFWLLTLQSFAQFADKKFYLVDSLEIENVAKEDKRFLDSCLTGYHKSTTDTARIYWLADIAGYIYDEHIWYKYNRKIKELAEQGLHNSNNNDETAIYMYELGIYNGNEGYYHKYHGNYKTSLKYYYKSLEYYEKVGDTSGIATQYNNMSLVYIILGDTTTSFNYTQKAFDFYKSINDVEGQATAVLNLGILYRDFKNYKKAEKYITNALELFKEIDDIDGIASSYCSLAGVQFYRKNYSKSISLNTLGLLEYKKIKNYSGQTYAYSNLAENYFTLNDYETAKLYADTSFSISNEYQFPSEKSDAAKLLYKINKAKENWKEALVNFEIYKIIYDSLHSKELLKAASKKLAKYEFEKQKAIEDAEHQKQMELAEEAKKRQKIIIFAVILLLVVLSIFLVFVFNRLKITRKQNTIIEQQKHLVEEKSKEISDSINYAKNIQEAILPDKDIHDIFDNAAILYKPKDVVSGDFYWMEQKEDLAFFAVADCTGHGVPGGFMSMIGTILLNEIFNSKQIYNPAKILDELNRLVVISLQKKGVTLIKDGMDISFCVLNKATNELKWAGANNPLWIVTDCQSELVKKIEDKAGVSTFKQEQNDTRCILEVKANKQPIGYYTGNTKPFTEHSVQLEKGDSVYIFTDGYPDQFGGPKGKKFKYKKLKESLLSTAQLSKKEQFLELDTQFENWKNTPAESYEQIDDVCVLGVGV